MQTAFDLSVDWYAGRADADWQPLTLVAAIAVFRKHGLTGAFWALS